jgi:hypothetical protein
LWFLGGSEVGVVLVDELLGVEAEVVRVGSEETLTYAGAGMRSNCSSSSARRNFARIRVSRSIRDSSSF